MTATPAHSPAPAQPAGLHVFRDNIMATVFEVRLAHPDAGYAAQAAHAAFVTAHHIEALLSRFIETSDVSQIRSLRPGESFHLHPYTAACLQQALEIMHITGGAFDPTLGDEMDLFRSKQDVTPSVHSPANGFPSDGPRATLSLDPESLMLYCDGEPDAASVHLDLGAIGKGFALDKMAEDLRDWDVTNALFLAGGSSSILAMDGPRPGELEGWCISLSTKQFLYIDNAAVSTSGKGVKGQHILDPRTRLPATDSPARTWAVAPSAAQSDALSTAWMLLSVEDMQHICNEMDGVAAVIEQSQSSDSTEPLLFIEKQGGQAKVKLSANL